MIHPTGISANIIMEISVLNSKALIAQTLQGIQTKDVALKVCDTDTSTPYILINIGDKSFGYVFVNKY